MQWFKFYPDRWVGSQAIRALALPAQGLLFHLICLAHQSQAPGFILDNAGHPLTVADIANGVGCFMGEAERLIDELRAAGLLTIAPYGEASAFFCQEVAEESAVVGKRREAGKPECKG